MPGRDIAALLQAEPTARALGAATGPTHLTDRREWLGQLIAAGEVEYARSECGEHDRNRGSGDVQLGVGPEVFAVDGRRIRSLVDAVRTAGRHEVTWHGRDDLGRGVASGVYMRQIGTRRVGVSGEYRIL